MAQGFLKNIDLLPKTNNSAHRTNEIDIKRLIVRRGQPFKIHLDFKNVINDMYCENMWFSIEAGSHHLQKSGKRKTFALTRKQEKSDWSASLQTSTQRQNDDLLLGNLIILFNPWCPDDAVFLNNEEERQEYVMNENGVVYVGNTNWISQRAWSYGQFDDNVIDICLQLLDRSLSCLADPLTDYTKRNDPVYISRIISAMINSNDDKGVITGRWNGEYTDGTSPLHWTGSTVILHQWYSSNFRPVKYGQCWVFAALLCTVMRCLGIPTRVVTNFDSAHDTDANLHIDKYIDMKGNSIESRNKDSIWNFHVWNESWMQRRDLPDGYGGWQALDATPQELSGGIFCCGPTSVKAVKEGDIHLDYDGPFVYAEVNADVISWVVNPNTSEKEQFYQDSNGVGRFISTKSVGSYKRMDVTNHYKYEEGTDMERKVFKKVVARINSKYSGKEKNYSDKHLQNPPLKNIGLDLKLKVVDSAVFGQDINLTLVGSNQSPEEKKLQLNFTVQALQTNGMETGLVMQETTDLELKSKTNITAPFTIPYSTYRKYVSDSNLFKVTIVGELLDDTHEKLLVERKVTLDTPSFDIEVDNTVKYYKPFSFRILFKNTLLEDLNDSVMTIGGSGLVSGTIRTELGTIRSGGTIRVKLELTPFKLGNRTLQVLITCDKIKTINGFKNITVVA
uniref:protein-glutamine gamma-glutamyltransferase n=1 Tax=Leptobrachium leishanense TaxID=445787 RepID=A0A8C5PZ60_9ANUR